MICFHDFAVVRFYDGSHAKICNKCNKYDSSNIVDTDYEYEENNESIEEIVYILEVAYSIAELKGFDKKEIEKIRDEKNIRNGSFSKNVFLINIR